MTQARTCANGLVTPSLPQPWLAALLRMFVELVLNVASVFQMRARRLPAECHSDVTPAALPEGQTGIIQESKPAATSSQTTEALMLRDRDAIVSKHEGVLTAAGRTLARHGDLSSRKRALSRRSRKAKAEALSRNHSPAFGFADRWIPALRRFAPATGMTAIVSAKFRPHPA